MKMNRILFVFGTRPEAIKMAPVVQAFRSAAAFETKLCVTGQHREMLNQVLSLFSIQPDFDLDVMQPDQQLANVTASLLRRASALYQQWRPDLVMVQGDTITTFAASLAAFYAKIPIAHVEAGLRTGNKYSPWPEEVNRCFTDVLASWHFAPTENARDNLLSEGIDPATVIVTGNTGVDAMMQMVSRLENDPKLQSIYDEQFSYLSSNRRLVLVTGHRRENFGQGLRRICMALRELARREDIEIMYPVHLNPNVQLAVEKLLGKQRNIWLVPPQEYLAFLYLLQRCYMIVCDSGGIQEEAPYLGKPVLLVRDTTERSEAVDAGTVKIVGTGVQKIIREANRLLDDPIAYWDMAGARSPFGQGNAAVRIVQHFERLKLLRRKSTDKPAFQTSDLRSMAAPGKAQEKSRADCHPLGNETATGISFGK